VTTKAEMAELAELIRRVLDAVDAGEMEADTPAGRAIVRRLEGAVVALEQASRAT